METNEMKNLLTKFFYKNDHLFYQIMIHDAKSMNSEIYGEYEDFDVYRRTLDGLQNNVIDGKPLRLVQDKTFKSEHAFAKVA
jgi:CRISPR/Cas system Type II protein with McrA/HNH and RuvC-like nuclease domain